MVTVVEMIPKENFNKFNELLKQYNGRYLYNPIVGKLGVNVHYEMGNQYGDFRKSLNRLTTDIIEKNSCQWYNIFLRRIKLLF